MRRPIHPVDHRFDDRRGNPLAPEVTLGMAVKCLRWRSAVPPLSSLLPAAEKPRDQGGRAGAVRHAQPGKKALEVALGRLGRQVRRPRTQFSKAFTPGLGLAGLAIDARTGTRTVVHASASMANWALKHAAASPGSAWNLTVISTVAPSGTPIGPVPSL
jgi:hypothetical protein